MVLRLWFYGKDRWKVEKHKWWLQLYVDHLIEVAYGKNPTVYLLAFKTMRLVEVEVG